VAILPQRVPQPLLQVVDDDNRPISRARQAMSFVARLRRQGSN
jgi:hypothetical protein